MFHVMGAIWVKRARAAMAALALLLLFAAGAKAQGFDETRYFNQCQLFEARDDLETARQF